MLKQISARLHIRYLTQGLLFIILVCVVIARHEKLYYSEFLIVIYVFFSFAILAAQEAR